MNVEELLYEFYEKRLDVEISSVAADLYFFLLRESSKKASCMFSESTNRVCMWLKIDKHALINARNELQKLGFISFVAGTGRKLPLYSIGGCGVSSVKYDTPNDTPKVSSVKYDTPNDTPKVSSVKYDTPNDTPKVSSVKYDTPNGISGENNLKEKKEENPPTPPKEEIKIKNQHTRARDKHVKTIDELIVDTEKRRKKFYNSLIPYLPTYGKAMLREFFDYWSEPNKSQTKMRFEQQPTWALNLRLARWANNNNRYSRNNETYKQDNGAAEREAAINAKIKELLSEPD